MRISDWSSDVCSSDLGKLYDDRAIKDRIASAQDYAARVKGFRTMADLPRAGKADLPAFDRAELLRRQVAAGLTMADMELLLSPMVEDAKEAIGRSEERRGGKECVWTCRSRGSPCR